MHNKATFWQGFSLAEVVIVIFILAVVLVGVLNLISRTFTHTDFVATKLTASYLAQEGIELVRNLRDSNWVKGEPWDKGISGGDFEIDFNDSSLSNWHDPGRYLGVHHIHICLVEHHFYIKWVLLIQLIHHGYLIILRNQKHSLKTFLYQAV